PRGRRGRRRRLHGRGRRARGGLPARRLARGCGAARSRGGGALRRARRVVAVNVQPLSEGHTREALEWHYEPPYAFHDLSADPGDVKQPREQPELYRAVLAPDGSLTGFWFFLHRGDEVIVGLGLRPDLTGRGLGTQFFDDALDYARGQWSPKLFRLW